MTGDSDYDIFEGKHAMIYFNNIVWVKVNKEVWQEESNTN